MRSRVVDASGEGISRVGAAPAAAQYPPIEPYESGYLEVDGGHNLYWEACGNPFGKPALYLHGGPGGACSASNRRLFDPKRYRIILFDQRGCGRSLPHAALEANTTGHLIDDIERLRKRLGIERWLLCGGSWGSTLALAYAETYPECVSAMILRGIFTARQAELHWLYRDGASHLFPDAWADFVAPIGPDARSDLIGAYHAILTRGEASHAIRAAHAWCAWEEAIMSVEPAPRSPDHHENERALLALARIETHYFSHAAFLEEGQLIANARRLHDIPAVIVQGRYDLITPPTTAWDLYRAWPQADLQIVPGAGHASNEPGILRRLLAATDAFADA